MSDSRPPGFLAPVLANAAAPAVRSILRTMSSPLAKVMTPAALTSLRYPVPPTFAHIESVPVPCPDCGRAWVRWSSLTSQLYDGGIGFPLSTDRRANVPVRCDRCRKTRHISGRAVGYRLRSGRPPLG
jgi:hypothetical protein